jgi:uncharacterized protein involved in cysteine biosynthesis
MATAASSRRSAAVGSARVGIARAIDLIGALVALILVVGILLVLLDAVRDAADWLAGPFNGLFSLKKHKVELAVNWGVAAVVWLLLARLIARVIRP